MKTVYPGILAHVVTITFEHFCIFCVISALLVSASQTSHLSNLPTTPASDCRVADVAEILQESNGPILQRFLQEKISSGSAVTEKDNSSFILATKRTRRRDPLYGLKRYYEGGWNISNKHYWASVGFTAVPLFLVSLIWFVGFGFISLCMCCWFYCCNQGNSFHSRTFCILGSIFLILFTCATISGCAILYHNQGKFYRSMSTTLAYIVSQANVTVENLREFSSNLNGAKKVGVDQIFLPIDLQLKIDALETNLNASANQLSAHTQNNSNKIQELLDTMLWNLNVGAAVLLLLGILISLFSILGLQSIVCILAFVGWILVAGTFLLCAVFLLLHNVMADTCVAMEEWVIHPQEHTALDDILPCVDVATANESLTRTKEVTYQLVNVVNKVISDIANMNFVPGSGPLYYNQSGHLLPTLCNPYNMDLNPRSCKLGEVEFVNATEVWRKYTCETSTSGMCSTVGRVTPVMYNEMIAAVNVSFGINHYTPFLIQLGDCTFVRDTFSSISSEDCPRLRLHSKWMSMGLVIVSSALLLSIVFSVIFARGKYRQSSLPLNITPERRQYKHP